MGRRSARSLWNSEALRFGNQVTGVPICQLVPRQARLVVPGLPHHIYQRGNNRRRLFSSDADRLLWLACVQRGLTASATLLHQHTLMSNHVHMIVTPRDEDGLAILMKRACQRYAQIRNAQRDATGKLFEERFNSKVIADTRQLMATTLYNDANAFRANLIADPLGDEWSTGPLHANTRGSRITRRMWTPSGWYVGLGRTPAARAKAYRALMENYAPVDEPPAIVEAEVEEEVLPYRRRVERPNGLSAREPETQRLRKA